MVEKVGEYQQLMDFAFSPLLLVESVDIPGWSCASPLCVSCGSAALAGQIIRHSFKLVIY
jgi:hypothetical protein